MTHTEKLALLVVDAMQDDGLEVASVISAILGALASRAATELKSPDDLTIPELDYWREIEYELRGLRGETGASAVDAAVAFLWALDRENVYFTSMDEVRTSAFTQALRVATSAEKTMRRIARRAA